MKRRILLFCFFLLMTPVFAVVKTSNQTGNWSDPNIWIPFGVPAATDDVVIDNGHTVTLITNPTTINNFTINAGGVLFDNNNKLNVSGNLLINGTYTGSNDITMTGAGVTIDGTGIFNHGNGRLIIQGNATILSTANLLKPNGNVDLDNNVIVTNNGIISIGDQLTGSNAASTWINAANSILKVGNNLLNQGVLVATAPGNAVEYYRAGNQNIKNPSGSAYYHLVISGSNTKNLQANVIINGNLTIQSGELRTNNNNINLRGNWENTGVFDEQNGTVTFDGAVSQTVTSTLGETFFNLTVNKTGGKIILSNNISVTNTLTMSSGNIDAGASRVTLGVGTGGGQQGTLVHSSGTIIGEFERWIKDNQTGTGILFPVGTDSYYRPALPTFSNITFPGGSLIGKFVVANPTNNGLPLTDGITIYNTFADGYWDFTTANGFASSNYNLELTGNGFNSFPITAATRLLLRANATSAWIAQGAHVAATGNTAKRSGLSSISAQYVFGDNTNCTAPITSSITGADSVCTNATGVTYSVTNSPGSTYTWTITGGTQASGGTTNSITVNWGATGMTGQVQVTEFNGCTYGFPVTKAVNIHTIAPLSVSGNPNVAEYTTGEIYSVSTRPGYAYTWTVTGGTLVSGQGTGSIAVDWGVAGAGSVSVVANSACGSTSAVNLPVNKYVIIQSVATGNWNVPAVWDCNCVPGITSNVRINNSHTVTLVANVTINHFIVAAGGTLADNGKTMTVTGNLVVDGNYTGTNKLKLQGVNTTIEGTGTISTTNDLVIENGNKTILSTAVLTKTVNDVVINDQNIVVNNYGNFTVSRHLLGAASVIWNNQANSTLNVGGQLLANNNEVLVASTINNTVNYNGAVNQNIKLPNGSIYYHLIASGAGRKDLPSALDINGNLTITGASQLDVTNANYNINLAGHWTNNSTNADPFVQRSGTVTLDGAVNQLITNSSDETYFNLAVNKATGSVNLAPLTDITITNLLTLTNGIVYTNGNLVLIPDNGSATPGTATSFVDGIMRKTGNDAFVFPVGNAGRWARIGISAPASLTTQFSAQYFNTANPYTGFTAPLTDVSANEYWILNRAVTTDNVTVKLYWENSTTSGINNAADLVVARHNGASWVSHGQSAIVYGASGNITSNMVSNFSPFAFGSTSLAVNPLPIELLSFTVELNNGKVDLNWVTATETNNDYFTIERTRDAVSFEEVGVIDGAGNSTSIKEYYLLDPAPFEGISYYRLKQTDFDGNFSYSDLVAVEYPSKTEFDLVVYPSPTTSSNINLNITGQENDEVLVVLTDLLGRQYYSKVVVLENGNYLSAIDHSNKIPGGVYMVIATNKDKIRSRKIVIK